MRVHHLNCISTCPVGGGLMDGRSGVSWRARLALHCLLLETSRSLVLVDTGLGLRDIADPTLRLSKLFLFLLRPELREEMTAVRQIARLGFDPRDVRHIVLTHLDFDHAGGLDDFPDATVHMLAEEQATAALQATWLDRARYRPQQWSTSKHWRVYGTEAGDTWNGFTRVRTLEGVPPEVVLIPLRGHTHGHAGVAVKRGDDWLFDAGDAYFFRDEMNNEAPRCTPGLRFYQWLMEKERAPRLENQGRLRALKRDHADVHVFCGHDPVEYERLAQRALGTPVIAALATPVPARDDDRVGAMIAAMTSRGVKPA